MKQENRIGVLLFLHIRNELSNEEELELLEWRQRSPENELEFQELSDPEYIRQMMIDYYKRQDLIFEKVKSRFPELANFDLDALDEEEDPEAFRLEEERRENFPEKDIAESGLSKAEFWASMLEKGGFEESETETEKDERRGSFKVEVLRVWRSSLFLRRSLRVACSIMGFVAALYVANYFMTDHEHENYYAGIIGPDGGRVIFNQLEQGRKAGAAHITFGETEKGEPLDIFPDHPKAALDKKYSLETEPGGEFVLQLPDRTRIWMNASSGVEFTANFQQDTIRVAIDGEAYFEISKTTRHHYLITSFDSRSSKNGGRSTLNRQSSTANQNPSTVNRQPSTIYAEPSSILNINTYPGNGEMLATLIRGGSVMLDSVAGHSETRIQLLAGKTAQIRNDSLMAIRVVDTALVMGWKNDELYYKDAPLAVMMPALASWYDVDIEYTGAVPDGKFSLRIPRSEPVSKVLDALRQQGLHITKNGRTFTIWK